MPTNEKKKRRWLRDIALVALLFIVFVAAFLAYGHYLEEQDRAYGYFKSIQGEVSPELRLEIANNDRERSRGLMYRKAGGLRENEGMIFAFPSMAQQKFWMANTFLSLDMVFIDNNWKIVGILHNVPPLTRENRFVDDESQYVVELLAGTARRMNLEVGNHLVLTKGEVEDEESKKK